jgi:hypothetical protein
MLIAFLPRPYWGFRFGVLGIQANAGRVRKVGAATARKRRAPSSSVGILVVRIIGNTVVKKK